MLEKGEGVQKYADVICEWPLIDKKQKCQISCQKLFWGQFPSKQETFTSIIVMNYGSIMADDQGFKHKPCYILMTLNIHLPT